MLNHVILKSIRLSRPSRKMTAVLLSAAMVLTSSNMPSFGAEVSSAPMPDSKIEETILTSPSEYGEGDGYGIISENTSGPDITAETISEQDNIPQGTARISDTESDNSVSGDKAPETQSGNSVSSNTHIAQASGAEPRIQLLDDGTYVAVKGQKIVCGIGAQSSDKKIIKIDKKGIGKAKKAGTATITYPDGQALIVNVIDASLSVKKIDMKVGDTISVNFVAGGAESKGLKIAWQAQDTNVIQNFNNKIVAVSKGKTKLMATVGGKTFIASVKVSDPDNNSVYVLNSYIGLKKALKIPFKATSSSKVSPSGGWTIASVSTKSTTGLDSLSAITTSGNDASGLTINKNKIVGNAVGKYLVSGNGRSMYVYVDTIQPKNPGESIKTGEQVLAAVPEHQFIVWKSKNPCVAAVSEYGYIIGESAGSTVITGMVGGKKAVSFPVTVTAEAYTQPDLTGYTHETVVIDGVNNNPEVRLFYDDFGHYATVPYDESEVIDDESIEYCSVDFYGLGEEKIKTAAVVSGNALENADYPSVPRSDPEVAGDTPPSVISWAYGRDYARPFDKNERITGNISLYAIYNTVNFYGSSGEPLKTIKVVSGNAFNPALLPGTVDTTESDIDADRVPLSGVWHYDPECTRIFNITDPIVKDTDLYLNYEYTNTVSVYGLDEDPVDILRVVSGNKITKDMLHLPLMVPGDGTRPDSAAVCLFRDPDYTEPYDMDTPVEGNFDLYAGYKTVDFHGMDFGAGVNPEPLKSFKILTGNAIPAGLFPTEDEVNMMVERNTYKKVYIEGRSRWFYDNNEDKVYSAADTVTDNVNLYAEFIPAHYVLFSFDPAIMTPGNTMSSNSVSFNDVQSSNTVFQTDFVFYNDELQKVPDMTIVNTALNMLGMDKYYEFSHWMVNGESRNPAGMTIQEDTAVIAAVKRHRYKVGAMIFIVKPNDPDGPDDDEIEMEEVDPGFNEDDSEDGIDIPEDFGGTPTDKDKIKEDMDDILDKDGDGDIEDDGWYYRNYKYYRIREENGFKYIIDNRLDRRDEGNIAYLDQASNSVILKFVDADTSLNRNTIWLGNKSHKSSLGGKTLDRVTSSTSINNIILSANMLIADPQREVTYDPAHVTWIYTTAAGTKADYYSKVYRDDASGYLFIIDDPTEDDDNNPASDDYAVIVGFDTFDGEDTSIPDEVDDPRNPGNKIPVRRNTEPGSEPGSGADDSGTGSGGGLPPTGPGGYIGDGDNPEDNGEDDTWWIDEDGTRRRKHRYEDANGVIFIYVLKDVDDDTVRDVDIIDIIAPPDTANITVPENIDNVPVKEMNKRSVTDLEPEVIFTVAGNNIDTGCETSIYGNVVCIGHDPDSGAYRYRRFGVEGDIVYIVNAGYSGRVIGAASDGFSRDTSPIIIPVTSNMKVSSNSVHINMDEVQRNAFSGSRDYKTGAVYGIYPFHDGIYTDLYSAKIKTLGTTGGIEIYTGANDTGSYYWHGSNNEYEQLFAVGNYYVAYTGNDRRYYAYIAGLTGAGREGNVNLTFRASSFGTAGNVSLTSDLIKDNVFRQNTTATYTFYGYSGAYMNDDDASNMIGGLRNDQGIVSGYRTEADGSPIRLMDTGNSTYIKLLSDSGFTYYLSKVASGVTAVITGVADNDDAQFRSAIAVPSEIPAGSGRYVSSVQNGAFAAVNGNKNVAIITKEDNSTSLGRDIIQDSGVKYETTDPAGNMVSNFGFKSNGYYIDGSAESRSQSYEAEVNVDGTAHTGGNSEYVVYTYKYVHPDGVSSFATAASWGEGKPENYVIITAVGFNGLDPRGSDPVTVPAFINGALVIGVHSDVVSDIMGKNRGVKQNTETGLPHGDVDENGILEFHTRVYVRIMGQSISNNSYCELGEARDYSTLTKSRDASDLDANIPADIDGTAGFSIDVGSSNQRLDRNTPEIKAVLDKVAFDYDAAGFQNPKLYYESGEGAEKVIYQSDLTNNYMPVMKDFAVYELRFDRKTYDVNTYVSIYDNTEASSPMFNMGKKTVRYGQNLAELAEEKEIRSYRGVQWYYDQGMTDRINDTVVKGDNFHDDPEDAGSKAIYGQISGRKYGITFDAVAAAPVHYDPSTRTASGTEEVNWDKNKLANWVDPAIGDNSAIQTKANAISGTRKLDTTYGYYNEEFGYYNEKVVSSDKGGNSKRLPGYVAVTGTDTGSLLKDTQNEYDGPKTEHYNFDGWYTSASGGQKVKATDTLGSVDGEGNAHGGVGLLTSPQDKGVTLYAHWTGKQYNLNYNGNGGSTPGSKTVIYGDNYGTLATSSRTGHTFKGWFTSASGGTQITAETRVAIDGDQTLYAGWKVNTYTIKYNYNCPSGATNKGGTTSNQTKTYGTNLVLRSNGFAVPTQTGYTYTFSKWNTKADGTGTSYNAGATMSTDHASAQGATVNLYAIWTKKANNYTLTYNANGGSVSPASKTVTFNTTYGTLPTPTRANTGGGSNDSSETKYTFDGWYTAKSGGTKVSSSTKMTTTGATIYAHWTSQTRTRSWINAKTTYDPWSVTIEGQTIYCCNPPDVPFTSTAYECKLEAKGGTVTITNQDKKMHKISTSGLVTNLVGAYADFQIGGTFTSDMVKHVTAAHWGDWSGWS